jgi:hypothetical protein
MPNFAAYKQYGDEWVFLYGQSHDILVTIDTFSDNIKFSSVATSTFYFDTKVLQTIINLKNGIKNYFDTEQFLTNTFKAIGTSLDSKYLETFDLKYNPHNSTWYLPKHPNYPCIKYVDGYYHTILYIQPAIILRILRQEQ